MNKANRARQIELDYMSSIGWGTHQVSKDVIVNGKEIQRRLDIGDENSEPNRAVEVKAYETGVVYATTDIKTEVAGDSFLISSEEWAIEWVFIGCRPSGPLQILLDAAKIKTTIKP